MELCSLPFQNQFLRSCRIWIACSCSTLGECAPSSSWHRWLMRPNGSSNRPPRSYPNPWLQTKESERCDVLHFSNPFPENDKRFFNNLSTTSFFFRHFFRLDLFTKITKKTYLDLSILAPAASRTIHVPQEIRDPHFVAVFCFANKLAMKLFDELMAAGTWLKWTRTKECKSRKIIFS